MTHHLFHHYDLIATGILLCMFLALLTVMAAKFTCRNKHTESQPPKEEKHPSGYRLEKTVLEKETSREEPKRKRNKSPYYESQFIQEAGITARTGKSVYIRKAHHDKITKSYRLSVKIKYLYSVT